MSGWICKLIGALAVFGSAWLTDRQLRRASFGREEQIRGYLALFEYLRRGIAYEKAPLDELFARCPPTLLAACADRNGVGRIADLAALLEVTDFRSAELEAIVEVAAAKLGRGYQEEQIAACDKYISALSSLAETCRKKHEERTRISGVLLYTASATLVLLLL